MSDPTIPVTPEDTTPPEPCGCIDKIDAVLLRQNTQLVVDIFPDGSRPDSISLATQIIVSKRGAQPARILANYCPICGRRYAPEAAS